MSSRALRKAQRQREEELGSLNRDDHSELDVTFDRDELDTIAAQAKPNPFAMLGVEDGEEEEAPEDEQVPESTDIVKKSISKPKNKKRKKKGKNKAPSGMADEQLDEIDVALQSLALKNTATNRPSGQGLTEAQAAENTECFCELLAIDTQGLNATNEMRRLFGRVALETDSGNNRAATGGGRRRGRGEGLAGAVAGQVPGMRGTSLGLRRNVFIQGKDTWPQATAGGLGMEVVEKREDGTVEYRFVHNTAYQDVQRQFFMCVESFDPERMIQLLVHNLHEIALAERDHSTAGDLLERALFSLGRSCHSTFAANLAQGKARLNFRRAENRELWLATWRYIKNLGRRGTWRTTFEWAKLLLSLSPGEDPYCVGLIIDQLALRAKLGKELLDLAGSPVFASQWVDYPNIAFSVALAHDQLKQPERARSALAAAIQKFPWIVSRMLKELNVERVPPTLWGLEPLTVPDRLLSELYVVRSKDIWNTPEATSLLVKAAEKVTEIGSPSPRWDSPITISQARHVLLNDIPALISLLPQHLLDPATSPLDPFPPVDDVSPYTTPASPTAHQDTEIVRELRNIEAFFLSLCPPTETAPDTVPWQELHTYVGEVAQNNNANESTIADRARRLTQLLEALEARLSRHSPPSTEQTQTAGGVQTRAPPRDTPADS
ncbi:hypothetical protein FGG08_002327 [Glutinoglossum americanum]|uniref:Transcription factor 25 n=1 Tax=Glutinoglossum americanum TaxID=1670608 RepID=A0A9P8I6J1_9PEZI|nr:hypothetical protein FGG08_002327 [Glutinoglossum americanum]